MKVDLTIIIINYRTPELTMACLDSIRASTDTLTKEVIVVDNGSGDESIEQIKKLYDWVVVIENRVNMGFGSANNLAAKQAKGEYLYFLNSDTILEPNTLEMLMSNSNDCGADLASCKLLNSDGTLQAQGGYFPTLLNVGMLMLGLDDLPFVKPWYKSYQMRLSSYFESDSQVEWLGGTALLVKRAVFDKLNGFDEAIFMYAEDIDLCYRARMAGLKTRYFSKPLLTHMGQGSSSSASSIVGEFKGLIYFFEKHKPKWQISVLKLSLKIGALLRIVIFGMIVSNETKKHIYQQAYRVV